MERAASDLLLTEHGGGQGAGGGGDLVRVLVVDDSATVRAVLARTVAGSPGLALAAVVESAEQALAFLRTGTVDVILLDLDMPGMGGLDAIPRLIAAADPARILVVSSLTVRGAEQTLAALSLGAADTLAKPRPGEFDQAYRELLLRKVWLLGRVARHKRGRADAPAPVALRATPREPAEVLAIGASTGGIHALGQLLGALPAHADMPILVAQHLPAAFSEALVRQLHKAAGREAMVAAEGMALRPSAILVAPGEAHLTVAIDEAGAIVVRLDRAPAPSRCRPSADPLFASCAEVFGPRALAVLLSGMGRDGVIGAAHVVEAGGTVLAQDAASSAVWGMPGAVTEAGLASAVLPPPLLAARIAATFEGA